MTFAVLGSTSPKRDVSDRHVVDGATVNRRLLAALGHAIIANNGSDSETIVAEDARAAGRLRRAGIDACARIGEMARLLRTQRTETRLLVASLKSPDDVIEAILAGAHDITAQPDVIRAMVHSPLTSDALAGFANDWRLAQQALEQG